AGMVGSALLTTLEHLEQDANVRGCVVVTHFPLLEQQLVRQPGSSFPSAYSGNLTLGRKVLAHRKVGHLVTGHAHSGRHSQAGRAGMPTVEVYGVPGDHERPGWLGLTVQV